MCQIEGAVTAAFAIPTYFFIVDFPDRATFLSQREREIRMQELNEDRGDAATSQVTLKNLKDLKGELAIKFILHTSLIIRRLDHLARHVHVSVQRLHGVWSGLLRAIYIGGKLTTNRRVCPA